jgi:hypothetical protein
VKLTLLFENLHLLAVAVQGDRRYRALEMMISKGRPLNTGQASPDHMRFNFSGFEAGNTLPIAAVTGVADGLAGLQDKKFWIRAEPVTMQADMARVVITGRGCEGFSAGELDELSSSVRPMVTVEGMGFEVAPEGRWYLIPDKPVEFTFTALDEAFGFDVANVFPDHPEALSWRRLMNDIQMALHAHPLNAKRRLQGKRQINSVWFWGGGKVPEPRTERSFDVIYANHPVSQGLALIAGSTHMKIAAPEKINLNTDHKSALIDWPLSSHDPGAELKRFNAFVERILPLVRGSGLEIELFTGDGRGWLFNRQSSRKFWRKPRSLSEALGPVNRTIT